MAGPNASLDTWIVIGRLLRARGNRGELIGEFDSADPQREDRLKQVALSKGGKREPIDLEEVWRHQERPIFKFVGVDSISQAEAWAGAEILVPPDEVDRPEAGAYTHGDLIGCRIESGGAFIGTVESVSEGAGPSLLQVLTADRREILIPFVAAYLQNVDIAGKTIRVQLPEGLLDL